MTASSALRRTFLLGAAAFLVAFEPVPVRLEVKNASDAPIRARLDADEPWLDVAAGQTVTLTSFPHAGLCGPPTRWLPEYFSGLDVQRADGTEEHVGRATFEQTARWGPGERWTFTVR